MYMTSEPDNWYIHGNKGLMYLFWFGLIPNIIYYFKNLHTDGNLVAFLVSSILLYIGYAMIVNAFGLLYFKYLF
jgi:hypothetical protein